MMMERERGRDRDDYGGCGCGCGVLWWVWVVWDKRERATKRSGWKPEIKEDEALTERDRSSRKKHTYAKKGVECT